MVEPASSLKPQATTSQYSLAAPPLKATCVKCKQSYLLHHLTTWRKRGTPLLLSKEGLILSKTEIDLPPTTSAAKKHSRPSTTAAATTKEADRALQQLRATSETTKSTQWKKAPGSCNARRLRRKPTRSRRPRHKQGGLKYINKLIYCPNKSRF